MAESNNSKESKEILVFFVRNDTQCGECGAALPGGDMIRLEGDRGALCLVCADLDHLDFLPRGDAALTRRSKKHSGLSAVVLKWSRSRNRYERQGILVEPEAIDKAQAECEADEEDRALRRESARPMREAQDKAYIASFAQRIRGLYPGCPSQTADEIALHACQKHSGRVGRSSAAKDLDERAVTLAVVAWVRHRRTNYDQLLTRGRDRREAREMIRAKVDEVMDSWQFSGIRAVKP